MTNILIVGGSGMVGSAIIRELLKKKQKNIFYPNRTELDLSNKKKIKNYIFNNKIDRIFIAAARVGGIESNNSYPIEFLLENLNIQNNVISSAAELEIDKLIFLGSSCIYPKNIPKKITENQLMTGPLEKTNESYAIAKIAGIKLCESYYRQNNLDFRCLMPSNIYGQNDNYNNKHSHVIPALIRRIHEAKINKCKNVIIWGSGNPRREFLYVDDLANACVHFMNISKKDFYPPLKKRKVHHLNIGYGKDYSIKQLAMIIKNEIKFKGKLVFDRKKLDGTSRKCLNIKISKSLGWKPTISLNRGIKLSYSFFLDSLIDKTVRM